MQRLSKHHRKKVILWVLIIIAGLSLCTGRLIFLMVYKSEYYEKLADDLHERERSIKAARGEILDRNGVVLASNKSVCTISVIHNQIEDPEAVISMLVEELGMSEEEVRKRVEKRSSIERIKTNVSKEIGDKILSHGLAGVKVDADYKRYYPYGDLASRVLGFTGSDNQGIIGLEVKYDEYLQGEPGLILTKTDARGVEVEGVGESRKEPVDGNDLVISMDYTIQEYCQQAAEKVLEEKGADAVSVIIMDPQNGEILAMVNAPEFDLNEPFTLIEPFSALEVEENDALNQMWRNSCLNDTYEPGSTFKIITTAAALEENLVSLEESFYCPGYITVEDRRIRCHKVAGHGSETFVQGIMNSCNPVFIDLGLRLGTHTMCEYFYTFGLMEKTGVDLPGEASTIMHKEENMGQVELATVAFGQSFQITPIQLVTTVSSLINGGTRVTPHFGMYVQDEVGTVVETFTYEAEDNIVSEETSETLRYLLEQVVAEGTGNKAGVEGFSIGGKTATSQTLPRSENKYISSFLGFAPADDPQVIGLVVIDNPQGIYYGGTIAAPVMAEIFENILPYLGIEQTIVENEPESVAN
ncbi:MAG: peptidoglycan glycosyltransferase [Eubacterium sp.]|nr:peptidoglycan glycosyltransferase [Eubacterium sp.]